MVCARDDEPTAAAATAYNITMLINTAYQRQLVLYPQPFCLRKHSIVQCGDVIAADGQGRSYRLKDGQNQALGHSYTSHTTATSKIWSKRNNRIC
jgi:hypothetical protein